MNKNFAVKEGSRVELICPASGTPQPTIAWLDTFKFHTRDNPRWQPQQDGTVVGFHETDFLIERSRKILKL